VGTREVVGPRPSPWSTAPLPWVCVFGTWSVIGLAGLVWLAGMIASTLAGHGWSGPAFDFDFGVGLLRQPVGPEKSWPEVPVALIGAVFVVIAVVPLMISAFAMRWWRRTGAAPVGLRGLAVAGQVQAFTPAGVRASARRLRPTLRASTRLRRFVPVLGRRAIAGPEAGILLGRHVAQRVELRASWEDVALSVMAPRSGKTTCQAVPAVLDAPGAAVATSNKADLWEATEGLRAERGRVWIFDPQNIARVGQGWWWNPLALIDSWEKALRMASHFMIGTGTGGDHVRGSDPFWEASASDLLAGTFLAAAIAGGSLRDVHRWITRESAEPAEILTEAGHYEVAQTLTGKYNITPVTRSGIYSHAETALACLQNQSISCWVTPPAPGVELDEFHPADLAASTDTVYLLSKDGATGAAPLVAALTDQIMQAAVALAEYEPTGRLDPPMTVILDEAANICKIADLPDLYSHLGSRGVFVLTILQSVAQGRRVWGQAGWDTLWGAATVKVIGAGCDDERLLEAISQAVGETEVTVTSVTIGGPPQLSTRRQRRLAPDAVRALPKGTALLLATGCPVAALRLLPWYEAPIAKRIRVAQAVTRATRQVRPVLELVVEGTPA
jgi:type IV secretory pathway TraG/TraD family ATPase VirD4